MKINFQVVGNSKAILNPCGVARVPRSVYACACYVFVYLLYIYGFCNYFNLIIWLSQLLISPIWMSKYLVMKFIFDVRVFWVQVHTNIINIHRQLDEEIDPSFENVHYRQMKWRNMFNQLIY